MEAGFELSLGGNMEAARSRRCGDEYVVTDLCSVRHLYWGILQMVGQLVLVNCGRVSSMGEGIHHCPHPPASDPNAAQIAFYHLRLPCHYLVLPRSSRTCSSSIYRGYLELLGHCISSS